MNFNMNSFEFLPPVAADPDSITISLVALQPKKDKKASPSQKQAGTTEQMTSRLEKIKVPQRQVAVKRQPTGGENVLQKSMKPKISLKEETQKRRKEMPGKNAARVKSAEQQRPVQGKEKPYHDVRAPRVEQFSTDRSETATPVEKEPNFGKGAPSESNQNRAGAALAAKGDTSAPAGLVYARPLYRKNPPPKYPRLARKRGYEGTVILEVLVDEKGRVADLRVYDSSGYEILDQSARTSVEKWLFEPGTKDGRVTQMWVRVPIRFKLNQ
jgi:protein TonB